MKKGIVLTFVLVLVLLLVIPTITAFDFDNQKSELIRNEQTSKYGKIEFRNSLFGWNWFQLDKIAEIELKTNTEQCLSIGCSAVKEIIMYEDGKLIDDVRFLDLETGKETQIESYEILVNGDPYNFEEVSGYSKGIVYEVELKGKLKPFQKVDWQIKSHKLDWIDEWAIWTSSLNANLSYYYDFNEGAGTNAKEKVNGSKNLTFANQNDNWNATGINGTARQFNISGEVVVNPGFNMSMFKNVTINLWFLANGNFHEDGPRPVILYGNEIRIEKNVGTSNFFAYVKGQNGTWSGQSNISIPQNHTWEMWTVVINQTDTKSTITTFKNGVEVDSDRTSNINWTKNNALGFFGTSSFTPPYSNLLHNCSIDELAFWNRSLTDTEITNLWNSGSGIFFGELGIATILNSPADNFETVNKNISFNCSANSEGNTINNITLYHNQSGWGENLTYISGATDMDSYVFQVNFTANEKIHWNCYSCDDTNNCAFSISNRTFEIKKLAINQEYWVNLTTEGASENYNINISLIKGLTISAASLIYNNTNYAATFTTSDNNYTVTRNLIVEQVTANKNLTFYWSFVLSDASIINTTSHNQSVLILGLDDCSTYKNTLFNITLYDEDTQTFLNGASNLTLIKIDFTLSSSDGSTELASLSKYYNNTNPATVCAQSSLNASNLRLDGVIEYSSLNRFTEFYNFQNYPLNGTSSGMNITLYNLNSSRGKTFKITYKDTNFVPVENAILNIQRKYVDEGVFKTTEIPKTGTEGYTLGHLVVNDVIYNIIISKNGEVLASFNEVVADCQNPLLVSCSINLNSYGSSVLPKSFVNLNDISFTLTYNKTTREVKSIYTIPSGATVNTNLQVTLFDSLGNNSVCNDTVYASGGQVKCTVPLSFGNSTVIATLSKDGVEVGQSIINIKPKPSDLYGTNIIFIGLMVIITLIGIGLTDNPTIMGLILILGVIMMVGLNIIYTPSLIGVGATILWFVVAIVLILIKGSNRQ